jgi:hypothetical protein
VYSRGLAVIAAAAVALVTVAGCASGSGRDTTSGTAADRSGDSSALSPASAGPESAGPQSAPPGLAGSGPASAPAGGSPKPGGSGPATGPAAGPCRLADLRFGLKAATAAGANMSATLTMTNISARRCTMKGYLVLQWRDAGGNVLPVKVDPMIDAQAPHAIAVPPGATAVATVYWSRYQPQVRGDELPCPPYPTTVEARLPGESAVARVPWIAGDGGGLCGAAVGVRPVDIA